MQLSYDKPPGGSLVYNWDGSYYYVDQPNQTQSRQNLNDLSSNAQKKPGPAGANLFVFHLPNNYRDSNLMELFSPFGNVISARIMTKPDGNSKG